MSCIRKSGGTAIHGCPGILYPGMMAKPMLVTLPFVLLLLDDWPLNRLRVGKSARNLGVEPVEKLTKGKKAGRKGRRRNMT